jgi:hypothetical protein
MAIQDLTGCIAAILVFAAFSAKRMVPLRTLGVASNIAFAVYASMAGLWPIFLLHSILLPMNAVRLREAIVCRPLPAGFGTGNDQATAIAANDNEQHHRNEASTRHRECLLKKLKEIPEANTWAAAPKALLQQIRRECKAVHRWCALAG